MPIESTALGGDGGGFLDPDNVLQRAGLRSGVTVADFGCGTGFFTVAAAKIIGEMGRVIALDVLPSALESVESRAKAAHVEGRVTTSRVDVEAKNGSRLDAESIDFVIAKDILFQNPHPEAIIAEVARVVRSGGVALFIEWQPNAAAVGPDAASRITPDQLKEHVERAGLTMKESFDAGNYHYGIVAIKK